MCVVQRGVLVLVNVVDRTVISIVLGDTPADHCDDTTLSVSHSGSLGNLDKC